MTFESLSTDIVHGIVALCKLEILSMIILMSCFISFVSGSC